MKAVNRFDPGFLTGKFNGLLAVLFLPETKDKPLPEG